MPIGLYRLVTAVLFWGCALFYKSSGDENHPFKSLCSQPMDRAPLKPELIERTLIWLICICYYVNQPTASYPMAADLPYQAAEEPPGLCHSREEDWIIERDISVKTGPSCLFTVHRRHMGKGGFNPSLSERQRRVESRMVQQLENAYTQRSSLCLNILKDKLQNILWPRRQQSAVCKRVNDLKPPWYQNGESLPALGSSQEELFHS